MLGSIVEKPKVARSDHDDARFGDLATTFAKDGYLRIPEFADDVEVAFIRTRLEAMWASKTGFDQGYQFDLVGDDDENKALAFPQIIHPSMFAPELLKTKFFSQAQELAKALLGPKARFSSDHALLKKPLIGPELPGTRTRVSAILPSTIMKSASGWHFSRPTCRTAACGSWPDRTSGVRCRTSP